MTGGLIVCNGQRFKAQEIGGWRVQEHILTVAREESVDLIWGVKFRTKVEAVDIIARTVTVDYRGESFIYYDSQDLLKSIGYYRGQKETDLTPELRAVWLKIRQTAGWHFVPDLSFLIAELRNKAQEKEN